MTRPPITDRFPALQFDRPWQLLRPTLISDPKASIRFDEDLLQQVIRGEVGPSLCIKAEPQCLVVTKRESRMDNFAQASAALAAEGWPVVVRCSGGSCVPQGPGILNLSVIHPRPEKWGLKNGYLLLCDLLGQLLSNYGIAAEYGEVPDSFCDGRYNLQTRGKKLVGTAQRWAGGYRKQAAVLAHACLLVDLDLEVATGKINRLYQLCNNHQQFDPKACTSLRDAQQPVSQLDKKSFVAEVEQCLALQISENFGIGADTL